MNPIAIILIAVPALTLLIVSVKLFRAMIGNVKTGMQVRQELSDQIAELPFGNVLALEGIERQALLHRVPLVELKQEIANCRGCECAQQCEQVLNVVPRDSQVAHELEFCPNMGSILQHKLSI